MKEFHGCETKTKSAQQTLTERWIRMNFTVDDFFLALDMGANEKGTLYKSRFHGTLRHATATSGDLELSNRMLITVLLCHVFLFKTANFEKRRSPTATDDHMRS